MQRPVFINGDSVCLSACPQDQMEKATPSVIQHMEILFGRIEAGFSVPQDVTPTPGVQYAKCREGSVPDVTVITTVGLNRFELPLSTKDRTARQELFMMFRDGEVPRNAAAVLHQIVVGRLYHRAAVLHGEVLKVEGLVFPTNAATQLFAARADIHLTALKQYQIDLSQL